jgi:heterodisulfide reductase subunit B
MKVALLRCCTTPIFLKQYETSTNAVLEKLGMTIVGDDEFNCCGYPLRNFNRKAYILASARNLALAERRSLDILTVCNCCFGSLKHAEHIMKNDGALREEIGRTLAKGGLRYEGRITSKHLLQVLYHDIGIETIQRKFQKTFHGLKIATHYGCHLLRPKEIVAFDNPFAPVKFDQLVEATGAKSITWSAKLDCCGSPLWGVNDELSMGLTERKLVSAKNAGADYLCVACSYCQLQFDRIQKSILPRIGPGKQLPSILYTQLLGLCLGVDEGALGLNQNQIPAGSVLRFLETAEPASGSGKQSVPGMHNQAIPSLA